MNAYKSVFRAEISDHIAMRSSIYSERTMRATVSVLLEFDGYLCDIGLYEKKTERTDCGELDSRLVREVAYGCWKG